MQPETNASWVLVEIDQGLDQAGEDKLAGRVVVEYQTSNQEVAYSTHTRSTASNLEQVANLLCAHSNSASYPQRDGKLVVAQAHLLWVTGQRPSVADYSDGVSASCTVGPIVR